MPKAKGRNAFFFFMLDWKRRAEAKGSTFPNGLKDVQADPDCNIEWQSLTKPDKSPFEAMAKRDKIESQIKEASKKTTLGESIKQLEDQEMREQQFITDMHSHIKRTIVKAVEHNVLPQVKFCFAHVNWFFTKIVDNAIEYFPAEYAIGVFSLENGIEDVHHAIVSSQIPLGYRREALETSQDSHNIPVESAGGESDFVVMYEKLTNFLNSRKIGNRYPPIYTTKTFKGAVQSSLKKLCAEARRDKEQFVVYEIESLFKHLADQAYQHRADREINYTSAYAEHAFTRVKYIYKRGTECIFHKYVDGGSEHCSKSVLHQWAWLMCEEFCEALKIGMKPGVHFPEETDCTYNVMMQSMANLDIKREIPQVSDQSSVVSMTGVSEQHRIKVSERTCEDEMRRRKETKPVVIIDHSKLNESVTTDSTEHIDNDVDKLTDEPKKTYVPSYLAERPMRPPKTVSYVAATIDDYVPKNDEMNFPPIGGRGVLGKKMKEKSRKAPMGRGQGYA